MSARKPEYRDFDDLLEVGQRLVDHPSGALGIVTIIFILAFIGGIR